ncbi:MAG: FAD-dependent thymidylate synthase, partial [Oscillospiraceae bacterium]|nr:FAD-dependent thymidylate synthase [Oscillospiraceae bacterium]
MAKVTLIAHTPDPEKTVAAAAKLCYSPADIGTLMDGITDEKAAAFLDMLSDLGHQSPIEHASFTFGIEGVSRALLAQITRHRIASFSVQSQRYVPEKEFSYVTPPEIAADEEAAALAKSVGVELPEGKDPTWGNFLYECFDQRVEEKLIQPTFITMHPVDVSPLAKRCVSDPRLTERFELFICHSEMGNAFSELNDPIDQKKRFQKQVEMRAKGDDEAGMMDDDYINALEY